MPARAHHVEVDEDLVQVVCPRCSRLVPEPLPRGSLVPVVHNRGRSHGSCRFWVSVDPRGDDHEFRVLENGDERSTAERETFEGTKGEVYPPHCDRVEDAVVASVLAERLRGLS